MSILGNLNEISKNGQRLRSFDFIRGLAILGIIIVHSTQNFTSNINYVDYFFELGRFGVQLFYFISALTMCYMWQLRKNEKNKIKNFYIRRFFRIVPLFWIAIIIYIFIKELNLIEWKEEILLSATLLHGFSHKAINSIVPGGWSIAVEAFFYLIFPFLIMIIKNNKNVYLFCAFIFWALYTFFLRDFLDNTLLSLNLINNSYVRKEFLYMTFLNQFPIFLLGCYMFFLINDDKKSDNKLLLFFISWIVFNLILGYIYKEGQFYFSSVYIFLGLFCFFCIKKNISFKPIEVLGKHSYAIYLFHHVVINQLEKIYTEDRSLIILILTILSVTLISLIISILTDFLIEKRFQKLANHFTK